MAISEAKDSGIMAIEANDHPSWLSVDRFEAEVSGIDGASHDANNAIAAASLYGIYSLISGPTGIMSYLSYAALALAARKIAQAMVGFIVFDAARTSLPWGRYNAL